MFGNLAGFFSSGSNIAFFILALFAIGGAIFMISFSKVVHMVTSMAFTFLSLAGLYILLEAEFVAFVQVLIYAGAITILMIFGIMMTKRDLEEKPLRRPFHSILLGIGSLGLFGVLFFAIQSASFPQSSSFDPGRDNTMEIGRLLYTQHVIPFELMSVLLTVAFIGAIIVAKREED